MNIVVNANSLLTPLTGIGQYTYQLNKKLRELDGINNYTYYYGFFSDELFRKTDHGDASVSSLEQMKINAYQKMKNVLKKVPVIGPVGRELRAGWSRTLQYANIRRRKFDLYFEPNFIPLNEIRSEKTITMIFDLSFLIHPEWHPKERVKIFEKHFKKGVQRSDALITATRSVKKQIVENLSVSEALVHVTPIDCNRDFFRIQDQAKVSNFLKKFGIPESFILFVGSIEPRKNILGLLKAYTMLPSSVRSGLFIVFCGPPGWKNEEVFQFIKDHDLQKKIIQLSYISDENLSYLYNKAQALVYPSFYEGFGLPPLEAMASGCPVIASDIPTHKEVCGNAVFYIDPNSPEQIAAAIQKIMDDSTIRMTLRDKGSERAKNFSWNKTAEKTLEIFNSLSQP